LIISEDAHESNAGPWERLASRTGCTLKVWRIRPSTFEMHIDDLTQLLTSRTRIVAVTHVSNLVGSVADLAAIVRRVKSIAPNARVVADGVAYVPHRAVDVEAWGVDWYVFSAYKVYGPHMAVLFGRSECWHEIRRAAPNHFFIPNDDVPYAFELGGVLHEGCAGLAALPEYLKSVAGAHKEEPMSRTIVEKAFSVFEELEYPLVTQLLSFLRSKRAVRIIGNPQATSNRVPTISFVHEKLSVLEIVKAAHHAHVAIRWGGMYAVRLVRALGMNTETGVVRVSCVHYNTTAEMERLIDALNTIL